VVVHHPKHIWQDVPEKVGVKNPGEWQNPSRSVPARSPSPLAQGQEVHLKSYKQHFAPPKLDEVFWR